MTPALSRPVGPPLPHARGLSGEFEPHAASPDNGGPMQRAVRPARAGGEGVPIVGSSPKEAQSILGPFHALAPISRIALRFIRACDDEEYLPHDPQGISLQCCC